MRQGVDQNGKGEDVQPHLRTLSPRAFPFLFFFFLVVVVVVVGGGGTAEVYEPLTS